MAPQKASPPQDHPELGPDPIAARLGLAFKSARLRYRGVEADDEADIELLFRIKVDPENAINASLTWPRPFTHAKARAYAQNMEHSLMTAIVELDPAKAQPGLADDLLRPAGARGPPPTRGVPIGMVALRPEYGAEITQCRTAALTVNFLSEYQGHGYGSEAMRWILDWAFDMAGMHRVQLACSSFNTKAICAYEAVGFERSGVEKEAVWCAGRYWDQVNYGILDRDWASIKAIRRVRGLPA